MDADRELVAPYMARREARIGAALLRALLHSDHPVAVILRDEVLRREGVTATLAYRTCERLEGAALSLGRAS